MELNSDTIRYSSLLYLIVLMVCSFRTHGQTNYVVNGGFEQYWRCPSTYDEIKFATGWQPIDTVARHGTDTFGNYNCAPEYCNTCAGSNQYVGVPRNENFYHYPHTGNGMAQVMMYVTNDTNNAYERDYMQGHLYKPLTPNTTYCVTFYITLLQASYYAVNHIGAYLDNGIIDTTLNCGLPQTSHIPQVQILTIFNDTLNWFKVEGSFLANGTERYITIGNFYSKTNTSKVLSISGGYGGNSSWYLVDDVSVVESDIPAYAGGTFFKAKQDSTFIGRNEIVPDCMWYRNGVLVDTLHAGFWVKDTVATTYVVKQSICGNVKYDTAHIVIVPEGVASVGNESVYRMYPNPAQHEVTIQAPNNTSTAKMAIYDLSGRVMMRQQVQFANGEIRIPLSLSGGVYVVELVAVGGGRSLQRLTIL